MGASGADPGLVRDDPGRHHEHPVGQEHRFVHVACGEENRVAVPSPLLADVVPCGAGRCVAGGEGLVQQQEFGFTALRPAGRVCR